MKTPAGWVNRITTDIRISILICTRLPLGFSAVIASGGIARASWALPVAGMLVGAAGAFVFWGACKLGLPPPLAAGLTLAATLVATGCLHEDGLADTADGFGGGQDRARKLEIMRDSRLGTYGACALAMSLLLRWAALAALAAPAPAAAALIAAHTAARAALPAFMRLVPPARTDGLSAQAGQPAAPTAGVAALIGIVVLTLMLGLPAAVIGLVLAALAGFLAARLSVRQIGGQTGDVLGALEQVIEIVILLAAVAKPGILPGISPGIRP
jgi:adenosylcobinamide-GDP ribazoletransferase